MQFSYVLCTTHLNTQGRGALQDIDQMSLFKPLCKFCATITHVRDIIPTLRRALQAAQSGTPGDWSLLHWLLLPLPSHGYHTVQ